MSVRFPKQRVLEVNETLARKAAAPPPPKKRGAGERAGLTMEKVLYAARQVLAREGHVNVFLVAGGLGVSHGSVGERLKRAGFTLDQMLASQFLSTILKPREPGDDWKNRIKGVFQNALAEASSVNGLARVITPFLAASPVLSLQFSDRLLYEFREAGLDAADCAAAYDVVMADLCGLLTVAFPDFGGDPAKWASAIAADVKGAPPDHWSSVHHAADQLVNRANAKVPAKDGAPSGLTIQMVDRTVSRTLREIEAFILETKL